MDYKPVRPRHSASIDGILPNRVQHNSFQQSVNPASQEDYHPNVSTSEPQPTSIPENFPRQLGSSQPSLLNATIPNPRYQPSNSFGLKSSKRKKWSRKRKVLTTFLVA